MALGKLGFGCMRLPIINGEEKNIDIEEFAKIANKFIENGFTYFDTSAVYHGGFSEQAVRDAVVKHHPREKFTIATKFPTFFFTGNESHEQVASTFDKQLENCGVEYFDYYLLHNLNKIRYDNVVKPLKLFEFIQEKKSAGQIRHIGFSFHDSADELDYILSQHPEVEFVQIVLNYYDWKSYFIQSKECYEVIRKHNKQVVIMEPVKGGMLSKAPAEAEAKMKALKPDMSTASWAIRFGASLDGVLAVLSGMTSMEQVEDNCSYMKNFEKMTNEEISLTQEVAKLYRMSGPLKMSNFSEYENINQKNLPLAALLDCRNSMAIQPNPSFSAEGNYPSLALAKAGLTDYDKWIQKQVITSDGKDVTSLAKETIDYIKKYSF